MSSSSERKVVSSRLIEKPDPDNRECSLITKFMRQSASMSGEGTRNHMITSTRELLRRCPGKPDELIEREVQDEGDGPNLHDLENKAQQTLREIENHVWIPASSWFRDVLDSDWFDSDRWFFSRFPQMFSTRMPRVYIEWDNQGKPEEKIQEWDPYEKRWKHTNRKELQEKWRSPDRDEEP